MSLLKSALTVSGLTLVSRVTGVIRDMLIARFFGASAETDAFYVAFRLPNMLRRLFAEGAFQQAFVPMLADVKERSEGEAGTFIDHVFTVLALSRGGAKTKHPENRGIYNQSDSSKKSSRNIWSLAVVSVDQRY